jgi:hypothetical protein
MSKARSNANAVSGAWRLAIFAAAILLPLLVTSCGKKNQEGEKKTVQKSEDDFLDKDAKPDEQKYLLAAKPFFVAVANRKYADAYALLASHARGRMSLDQFAPAQQDSDSQQNQSYAFDNATAEQFVYLMQYVEASHGAQRAPKMLHVFSTHPRRFEPAQQGAIRRDGIPCLPSGQCLTGFPPTFDGQVCAAKFTLNSHRRNFKMWRKERESEWRT